MATLEQRVNIALDTSTLEIVKRVARETHRSISRVCADLIRGRIEDDEDAYYAKLLNAMEDLDFKPRISSEEMLRRLDALQN